MPPKKPEYTHIINLELDKLKNGEIKGAKIDSEYDSPESCSSIE